MARTPIRRMHSLEVAKKTGSSPTSSEDSYVVAVDATLRVVRFSGGIEHSTKEVRIELLWGNDVVAVGYGLNFQLAIDADYIGDGATALTIRHTNGDNTALHMSAWWEGMTL